MTGNSHRYRLEGLEPDNLLAFLALLGLLRALETARPQWHPRGTWDLERPPLRPILTLAEPASVDAICEAAAAGIATLAAGIDFGSAADLKLDPLQARGLLRRAASGADTGGGYFADLCAALVSDAALSPDLTRTAPTPLAYDSVARINFLDAMKDFFKAAMPETRNRTRDPKYPRDGSATIEQALFQNWERLDRPAGLRWDPDEARRHAYQWYAPTDEPGGPKTQHGANRLAVIGLSVLAAAPAYSGARVLLAIPGGEYERGGFTIAWPIWRAPASLAAIRALLSHPKLREPQALAYLGVDHVRIARRISLGKYRNFAYAAPLPPRIPDSG